MMKSALVLLALFGAALAQDCFPKCAFKFCNLNNQYTVSLPGLPFTGTICLDGKRIGPGANSGEPLIGSLPAKPISQAALSGLKQPFSPSFIKTLTKGNYSALAHETPQGNQATFLEDLCFKVPIKSYTVKVDGVYENKLGTNNETDCIAVVTELPDPIPVKPLSSPTSSPTPKAAPAAVRTIKEDMA